MVFSLSITGFEIELRRSGDVAMMGFFTSHAHTWLVDAKMGGDSSVADSVG